MLEIQIAPPFEVLINNGANQLLLDLVLGEETVRNVQNFLRNKKSRGQKQNKKMRPIAKHNKCGSNNKYSNSTILFPKLQSRLYRKLWLFD